MKRLLAGLALLLTTGMAVLTAAPASASTSPRVHAYEWAYAHGGDWYCWGGTGPSCFDCSGLVYAAYGHSGIWLPRTTYGMLGSWRARFVSHADARDGDLVFFGDGHVELYAGWHRTLGALESGTRVGFHSWSPTSWWRPTAYVHIRGSW